MTSFVPGLSQACSAILRQVANKKLLPFNVQVEQVDPIRPQIIWWDIHDPYNEQLKIVVDILIKPSWFGNNLDILHIDGRTPWITENYLVSKRNWPKFRQNMRGYLWNQHTQPEADLVKVRLKWHARHWRDDVLLGSSVRHIESMAWPDILKLRTLDEILYLTRRLLNDKNPNNLATLSKVWSRIALSDTLESGAWVRPYHNPDLLDDGYLVSWSEPTLQRVHVTSVLKNRWMVHTHDIWELTLAGEFILQNEVEASLHANKQFLSTQHGFVSVNYGHASLPMKFQTFSLSDGKAELESLIQSIQAAKLELAVNDLWYNQTQDMRGRIPNMNLFGATQLLQIKRCTELFLQYAANTFDYRLNGIATAWSVQNAMNTNVPNSLEQWKQCATNAFGILDVSTDPVFALPAHLQDLTEKSIVSH